MRKRIRLNDEFTELQTPSLLGIDLTRHKVPSNHSVRSKYDERVTQSNRWQRRNGLGRHLCPDGRSLRNYPFFGGLHTLCGHVPATLIDQQR